MMEIPTYPKIPWYDKLVPDKPCIAFEKYDGTNLAWHYNRQNGFQDFYTRRRSFDNSDADFGNACQLFSNYQAPLQKIYQNSYLNEYDDLVVYAEYFGPNSFGGFHDPKDQMQIVFLDLCFLNSSNSPLLDLISPFIFTKLFTGLPTPKVIYQGKITGKFTGDVKNGKYPVNEGVVCKGFLNNKVWMCKIKTQKWLDRLQQSFKEKKKWIAPDQIERSFEDELPQEKG